MSRRPIIGDDYLRSQLVVARSGMPCPTQTALVGIALVGLLGATSSARLLELATGSGAERRYAVPTQTPLFFRHGALHRLPNLLRRLGVERAANMVSRYIVGIDREVLGSGVHNGEPLSLPDRECAR